MSAVNFHLQLKECYNLRIPILDSIKQLIVCIKLIAHHARLLQS